MPPPDIADDPDRPSPRLLARLAPFLAGSDADETASFRRRLDAAYPRLAAVWRRLYGDRADGAGQLEDAVATAAAGWAERPAALKARDRETPTEPPWFQSNRQVGAVCYVDLFAGSLAGLRERIGYLSRLGITYLHLMPLLRARAEENDGGYAVASYREVEPRLGTMAELAALAAELHEAGIRLCLDLVLNHTADDHDWALAAKAGDLEKQGFYRLFDDRSEPDRLARNLREIFPEGGGDPFIFVPELGKWAWSTFYPYQWDLDFGNPALFRQMLGEMLFLANRGVDVLRLDAVPFIGKRAGTSCENLPEAHWLVQAFNALVHIAAPALAFKSEAIVHPDEVARYVGPHEAQLSYHPALMVLLWEALATRETDLLRHTLIKRFEIPAGTAWVNYIRCHDDIGWGFADEDAGEIGIDGAGHRAFLNAFYTGRFPGSFARGLPFQENPRTGDCRISGTAASLAGLEAALEAGDGEAVDLAIGRLLLLHGVILTIGGLPLLYLGDEVARLNDRRYRADPTRRADNRWAHRPATDWPAIETARKGGDDPAALVLAGLTRLIALRRSHPALAGRRMEVLPLANRHVLGYRRDAADAGPLAVLANFSERPQLVEDWGLVALLGEGPWTDLVSGERVDFGEGGLLLAPYRFLCLEGGAAAP
ncbi:MAG: DUF3459 domain-containing protein [Inquilinus sp.]|nr:DUF3459 domain-containing protein [Inquilinus sp.]